MTTIDRQSARPSTATDFDVITDVVVVGGGGGGLPAALFNRWNGAEVVLLEKADQLGGTANKAAYWYWVPNNEPMRAAGLEDPEDGFLRYTARLSRPAAYDKNGPTLGLSEAEYAGLRAIYASASPAAELLKERGALVYRHCADVPDYHSELAEDSAPRGRVLIHSEAAEDMHDGGVHTVRTMTEVAERDGVDIRVGHRVQRTVVDPDGRVIGVEATGADGSTVRVGARRGVVFATGGFSYDTELRRHHLSLPLFPGCAVHSNEGDFLRISMPLGAQPRNMNAAWMCPVPLEKSVDLQSDIWGIATMVGDSMIIVDKTGRRAVNEKLQYHEIAQSFFTWDGEKAEFPRLVMVCLWDQRVADNSGTEKFGSVVPAPGSTDTAHVITGRTIPELGDAIRERYARYAHVTGGAAPEDDFTENLLQTIETFNGYARAGHDPEFHRGEKPIQHVFNGAVPEGQEGANRTMYPISDSGPYYACLIAGGTLDTKGGPKVDPETRVLDDSDQPIPGLYGVGNCVASFSGNSYWAGGATLGPIIAFAYRGAAAIAADEAVELTLRVPALSS